MKVLHILDSLNRGGTETLALDLCRNAAAHGLDLTFAATGSGDLETEFRASGTEFVRLDRRLPLDPALVAALRALIRARGVGVVHCHQAVETLHAYLATRGTQARLVQTLHGWIPDWKNRLAWKYLVPRVDANLTVSRDLLDWLASNNLFDTSKNFRVLYNGVDPARLRPTTGRDARAELGLPRDALIFGMVGNFYLGVKDQLTICRALPRLFAAAPASRFVFVGGRSADAPQLFDDCVRFCREQGIGERVHFLGKRADVPEVLAALDVFAFSSLREGAPLSVIEAMLVGLPVVATDIPALREVTGGGSHALTFRAGDDEDLAAKMIELARDPARRAHMGEEAQAWAAARFSISAHIKSLIELYDSLAVARMVRRDGQRKRDDYL